ncbi:MAG: phosphoribosyl-ATP diphosphatase [Gammaproteobacteria bacterium]|nr:phosphoribosyl-ATP diphosphatase [Gammaproteobacteria bacterium]
MEDFAILHKLELVLRDRLTANPKESYAASIYEKGIIRIMDKLGEEMNELMVAVACDKDERVVSEAADTYFHLLIFITFIGLPLDKLTNKLTNNPAASNEVPSDELAKQTAIRNASQSIGIIIARMVSFTKDDSSIKDDLIKDVNELFTHITQLHLSRNLGFGLVADELNTRVKPK